MGPKKIMKDSGKLISSTNSVIHVCYIPNLSRQEMDRLNEELKQKEAQLSTFGKTLSDLETATR